MKWFNSVDAAIKAEAEIEARKIMEKFYSEAHCLGRKYLNDSYIERRKAIREIAAALVNWDSDLSDCCFIPSTLVEELIDKMTKAVVKKGLTKDKNE